MAPPAGQFGMNKKGSAMPRPSRNSTPVPAPATASLPPQEFYDPDYLNTRVILFRNLTYDDLVDSGASSAPVPDSKSVDAMLEKLKSLVSIMEKRSTFYDRGMRHLADERKKRPDNYDRPRANADKEARKTNGRRKRASEPAAAGKGSHRDQQSSPACEVKQRSSREASTSSSLSPIAAASPSAEGADKKVRKPRAKANAVEETSSSDEEVAPPKRELPHSQTFGDDPSTFLDPTIYEIREIKPGMSEEKKKEIYSVACYPKSDLADMIAGDPPDRDFSSAKPSSQINFSTFSTYLDPYFRPFSEEDIAFLRERGDRVTPFILPRRGKRHYTEVWAEEDGAMAIDSPCQGRDKLPPNQPRGSIENVNDAIGETDKVSLGPLAARLLQMMRPERRRQPPDEKVSSNNGVPNGDVSMNGDANEDEANANGEDRASSLPPATHMSESNSEAWRKATHPKLDFTQVDERLKQELRHVGFLPIEGFEGDYDGHFDDEVAGRLRFLQARLKEQLLINGARKARLMELVREHMAHQEYQTILKDLDSQVQAAYMKRTQTMGKSKKTKRPGGAAGGSHFVGGAAGTARPGIGDLTKTLMERRRRWIDTIGSVFDDESLSPVPRSANPDSSIFKEDMVELMKKEQAQWDDEVEE